MAGVLEGIRVLDFGRYIAGPYCAALMAEHGAEVIRIEKREGSEDRFQAPVATTGEGALFLQMNRNKRGMTLDPMRPEGQEVVRKLVKTADVVVANLPPQPLVNLDAEMDLAAGADEDQFRLSVLRVGHDVGAAREALRGGVAVAVEDRQSLAAESKTGRPVLQAENDAVGLARLVRIGRAQHDHVRNGAQPRELLDGLVRRSILAHSD